MFVWLKSTLFRIILRPKYFIVMVVVSLVVIVIAAWLPNLSLVIKFSLKENISFSQKANLLISLIGSLKTNFTTLSLVLTTIGAILTGVQTSLLIYYLKQSFRLKRLAGTSVAGTLLSLIGVGCASCGSVILSSVLGLGFTTRFLGFFPFKGQEIGFLGIVVLVYVIRLTLKKIKNPLVCKIN
jgi:hypothetical protein